MVGGQRSGAGLQGSPLGRKGLRELQGLCWDSPQVTPQGVGDGRERAGLRAGMQVRCREPLCAMEGSRLGTTSVMSGNDQDRP